MKIMKITHGILFAAAIGFPALVVHHPAHAADELYLTGIIKDIDHSRRTVFVDVQSSSCKGLRIFGVDDPYAFEDLLHKKIDFHINSSICESNQEYRILQKRRGRR